MPLHDHKHQRLTWAGMLMTLGIVFGDIGTSPLYVFKAIVGATGEISEEVVLGGLSCIFWTLTLVTSFKYIYLTLQADNRGEGGVFSLYALVRRFGKWLWLPAIVGAATLLADGFLTPSISVASAIEGLSGVKAFEGIIESGNTTTVLVVVAILSLLFFFQRFGTKVVGFSFGPIMLIWFSMLMVLGVSQIVHNPHVLASINPVYAVRLLTDHPGGFWLLGAVFLCTTGAEGLYNDLGHCGRQNIRATWTFVKVALVCNYMGQGAWLLKHEGMDLGEHNPFFEVMPEWFLLIGVGISTLAAIVACQAVISGSFTLINEAITLNFWPRVRVKFPTDVRGQIYIPSVNWLLWAGCMGVMFYFRSSAEMEAAYGFFIVVAMLMTTLLLFGYMRFVRRWHLLVVLPLMALFLSVEMANFVANAVKILHRPLLIAGVVLILGVMFIWFHARKIINRFIEFVPLTNHVQALRDLSNDKEIPKYATHLAYLTKADNPAQVERWIIHSLLARKVKRADIYWFVHVNYTDEPYTMEYRITELIDDKVIRVDFNLGFRVQPRINLLFRRVLEELDADHELEFRNKYESIKKGDFHTDILYVITERVLSVENEFSLRDGFILDAYFLLKGLSQGDREAMGLDPNVSVVEKVPLVIQAPREVPLVRVGRRQG
ncbi:MAG: KUP/HAK/KT family potassium transporter [Flavobacteriales bacterium]|nr:KUP/HAK/KT family potassium transporter [Flavobacteriales bacterium]MBP9081185.1 KUP/HAK/KT family potassium transporter [Flavobacteriales bacterium]